MNSNVISSTLKSLRKEHNLTQVDLAMKSGVGLNFVRELEQGKATVRLDKVAQVFDLFGYELVPQKKVKGVRHGLNKKGRQPAALKKRMRAMSSNMTGSILLMRPPSPSA